MSSSQSSLHMSFATPPDHGSPLRNGRRGAHSHQASHASLAGSAWGGAGAGAGASSSRGAAQPAGTSLGLPYPVHQGYQSHANSQASLMAFPHPFPPPSNNASHASLHSLAPASIPAPPAAQGQTQLPPFRFVRLKSFSTHTHALLRRIEGNLAANPASVAAWLALGEEYRVLGARGAFLRLLEHAHQRFPADEQVRSLLYSHAPHRPRTPPPPDPLISTHRTPTYDYKWRNREPQGPNIPNNPVSQLDTSVPPVGRQMRSTYLAFLALLQAEDVLQSEGQTRARRARARQELADFESRQDQLDPGSDVVLVIPPRFNAPKDEGQGGVEGNDAAL